MAHLDSADFPLLQYLDNLVEDLRRLVSKAVHGDDVDAVHDARVATRRLKAAVDLMDSVLSGRCKKPFAKVTRALRKQLGPLRDLDVMLEHLDEVKEARFQSAAGWLRGRLEDSRKKTIEAGADVAPPARMLAKLGTWWGLRHEIVDAQAAVDHLLAESVHWQLDEFSEQAGRLVKVMADDALPLEESGQGNSHSTKEPRNDPHELRIAGKSLRYTLEMAKEHGRPLPKSVMAMFKRMQEALGLWHDYIVLTERMLCETVEGDLALHNPRLEGEILGLAQAMLRKAQANLKKMADLWKEHGEELSGQIRGGFALTRPVKIEKDDPPAAPDQQPSAPAA